MFGQGFDSPRLHESCKPLNFSGLFFAQFFIFVEMISDEIRQKLQNIIRGELHQGQSDACTAVRDLLCKSFSASPTVKSEFESRAIIKEKQVGFLKSYAQNAGLWMESLPQGSQYLAEGGESKVYLSEDGRFVFKVNDAGYYATWTEYFNSLLLHNLLFSNSAYSLLGFIEIDEALLAVVQQLFVAGDQASLEHIEEFLGFNGFAKSKRQDYYNSEFRLVLEDMHDENVIAKDNILFFIDTVFYIL
jgi:serine/threonin/tyrosin kinase-like protein